jgi:shikimate kinase
MASGKSHVGSEVAQRLGRDFVDNDGMLEAREGRSAREIEAADGQDALHKCEAECLVEALARPGPAVIAAAAGAVLVSGVADALAAHDVVYLRVPPEVLASRVPRDVHTSHRPFEGAPLHVFQEQFRMRDEPYRRLAIVVDGNEPLDVVIDEVMQVVARS